MSLLNLLFPAQKKLAKAVTLIEHTTDKKIVYSVYRIINSVDLTVDQERTRWQVKRLLHKGWKVAIVNEQVKGDRV